MPYEVMHRDLMVGGNQSEVHKGDHLGADFLNGVGKFVEPYVIGK